MFILREISEAIWLFLETEKKPRLLKRRGARPLLAQMLRNHSSPAPVFIPGGLKCGGKSILFKEKRELFKIDYIHSVGGFALS